MLYWSQLPRVEVVCGKERRRLLPRRITCIVRPEDQYPIPDHPLPNRDPSLAVPISLSRETMMLIGALAFLTVAVAATLFLLLQQTDETGTPSSDGMPIAQQPQQTTEPTTATTPDRQPATPSGPWRTPTPTDAPPSPTPLIPDEELFPSGPPTPIRPSRPPATETPTLPPATDTPTIQPTDTPAPTETDSPTDVPPTDIPTADIVSSPTPAEPIPTLPPLPTSTPLPTPTSAPTELPVDRLTGETRWLGTQSPIVLNHDVRIAPGSVLIIEEGVEVRLGWDVAIIVDEQAQLIVLGTADRPVRFVGQTNQRWEGIYGRSGSRITLNHAEVRGAGSASTILTSEYGELIIQNSSFRDNGGTIVVEDSTLEVRNSEIVANDLPWGAALNAHYTRGNTVSLSGNHIGGNRLQDGAPSVLIQHQNFLDTLLLDIQGNVLNGGVSGNLKLDTNGPLEGTIACNALVADVLGLSLRTQTLQVPQPRLQIFNNLIDQHTPPIEPIYLEFGIGRGAVSEVALDMRNNWWGDSSGPYHPQGNPEGRGDSVGTNIEYIPWLRERPACVPQF